MVLGQKPFQVQSAKCLEINDNSTYLTPRDPDPNDKIDVFERDIALPAIVQKNGNANFANLPLGTLYVDFAGTAPTDPPVFVKLS